MEIKLLWVALIAYVLAGALSIITAIFGKQKDRAVLLMMVIGLALHTTSIALRWERLGHGPFVTMFEILSSNVWSFSLIYTLAYWRMRIARAASPVVLSILFIMMGWLLMANPGVGNLPPTYRTIWLYIHIGFGKVHLGAALIAVGIAGIIILRSLGFTKRFAGLSDDQSLDHTMVRLMRIALVFQTLMLIAGAIWAQGAWGRYWAWDPLETWAFLSWLMLGIYLHIRAAYRITPLMSSAMVIGIYVLAFLTFFGIPFVSMTPHKGAI